MANVKINGIDLTIDMLDADTVEKYQKLNEQMAKDIKDPKMFEGLSVPDAMRKQCSLVDKYLDDLFGAGTADKVFQGNKGNLGARLDAFALCSRLSDTASDRITALTQKYGLNRAQRRATAKQGK